MKQGWRMLRGIKKPTNDDTGKAIEVEDDENNKKE